MGKSDCNASGAAEALAAHSAETDRVLDEIAKASRLSTDAARAYGRGDKQANSLRDAAYSAHLHLLRAICELSEAEADFVEPAFTELEKQLMLLP